MARLSASVFAPALRQALPVLFALAAGPSAAQLPERPASAPDAGHCLPAPPGSLTPQQARLTALLDRIEATFAGPDPLIAAASPAAICLDDRPMEGLGFYEPDSQSLVLDAGLSDDLLFPILVHELRHVWQYNSSYCPSLALSRSEHLLQIYAMEADAQAIATLYGWAGARAGQPAPWAELEHHYRTRDIAARFRAAAEAGASEAEAVAAAFAAWYDDPDRVETYYRAACSAWYDALDKAHIGAGSGTLAKGHFDRLCRLPDGSPYPCRPRLPSRP